MAEYLLHSFAQSGNAYKAALFLQTTGCDWEPSFVDFFKGGHRSEDYTRLNEMAEVPTLEHKGQKISQSGVILDYLVEQTGQYGPASPRDTREIMRWLLWDNHKLTANLATGRFMANFLPEEKRNQDVIDFLIGRAKAACHVLENRLAKRDWIVGKSATIADFSCIGYMYFEDEIPIDFEKFPAIQAWKARMAALPNWKHPYDLMPGHPL